MGTVFLTNFAAVAGKYERYDVLSAIMDFETHNRLPLEKLRLLKENPDEGKNFDNKPPQKEKKLK